MSPDLKIQKMEMQIAINWMNTIEACDLLIESSDDVEFYKVRRQTAINGYVATMESIVNSAILISSKRVKKVA